MMEENNNENIDKDLNENTANPMDSMFGSLDDTQSGENPSDLDSLFEEPKKTDSSDDKNDELSSLFEDKETPIEQNTKPQSSDEDTIKEQEQGQEASFESSLFDKPDKEISNQNNENKDIEPVVTFAESGDEELLNHAGSDSKEMVTVRPVKFQEFIPEPPNRSIKKNLDIMQDVSMHISVELGRTKSSIRDVMEMERGSIVELNKIAGEQVEIYVNEKLVAKGEVIVIEDKFGVRVTSTSITKAET